MKEVLIQYQKRGWKITYNNQDQAIFKEPKGIGFFVLLSCSDSEKRFINFNNKKDE